MRRKSQTRPGTSNLSLAMISAPVVLLLAVLTTAVAQAQTFSVLYTFNGTDGSQPESVLTMDAAGNLYGTTSAGGNTNGCNGNGCGTVFKLDTIGNETALYAFSGGSDGSFPYITGVILDAAGNLYGATSFGGNMGHGVVYKVDPHGKETVLHSFPASAHDGAVPQPASLMRDPAGNLYGTTLQGDGNGCRGFGCGSVFRLDNKNKEKTRAFNEKIWGPTSIVLDPAGNLYGTTLLSGGTGCNGFGCGTVYRMDSSGKRKVLYRFQGAPDGAEPFGALTLDQAGNLYGATLFGGDANACPTSGCGIVFKISPSGKETILHTFEGPEGSGSNGGLVLDSQGNIYGTAVGGGTIGAGTIFKIDTSGVFTVLYSFTNGSDGGFPSAGLIRDNNGNLYGTTIQGGNTSSGICIVVGCGTVFKLTP